MEIIPFDDDAVKGDAIIPEFLLKDINIDRLPSIIIFKVSLPENYNSERYLYVSVKQFSDIDCIAVPYWIYNQLKIEGCYVPVSLQTDISKISQLTIYSDDSTILDNIGDIEEEFTNYFNKFKVLQKNLSYPFKNFTFTISSMKNNDGIEIDYGLSINTDIELEFDIKPAAPIFRNGKSFNVSPNKLPINKITINKSISSQSQQQSQHQTQQQTNNNNDMFNLNTMLTSLPHMTVGPSYDGPINSSQEVTQEVQPQSKKYVLPKAYPRTTDGSKNMTEEKTFSLFSGKGHNLK